MGTADGRDDKALEEKWKFQGTPGPWRLGNFETCIIATSDIGLSTLGLCDEGCKKHYGGNLIAESMEPVNAKLIRMAPTMLDFMIRHLEVLKVENLGTGGHWDTEISELTDIIELALGTIKKD